MGLHNNSLLLVLQGPTVTFSCYSLHISPTSFFFTPQHGLCLPFNKQFSVPLKQLALTYSFIPPGILLFCLHQPSKNPDSIHLLLGSILYLLLGSYSSFPYWKSLSVHTSLYSLLCCLVSGLFPLTYIVCTNCLLSSFRVGIVISISFVSLPMVSSTVFST